MSGALGPRNRELAEAAHSSKTAFHERGTTRNQELTMKSLVIFTAIALAAAAGGSGHSHDARKHAADLTRGLARTLVSLPGLSLRKLLLGGGKKR